MSKKNGKHGTNGNYEPKPEHKFSFGLWTLGNRGRDPFGDAVRPHLSAERHRPRSRGVGAWGVNLHDNDLVPIDATPTERDQIVRDFKRRLQRTTESSFPWRPSPCSSIRSSGMAPSPPTIPRSAPTLSRKPCAPWIWAPNLAQRFLCYGEAAKA